MSLSHFSTSISSQDDPLYEVYAEVAQLRRWIDEKIAANGGATFCSAGTTVRSTTPQQTFDTEGKGSKKMENKAKENNFGLAHMVIA